MTMMKSELTYAKHWLYPFSTGYLKAPVHLSGGCLNVSVLIDTNNCNSLRNKKNSQIKEWHDLN